MAVHCHFLSWGVSSSRTVTVKVLFLKFGAIGNKLLPVSATNLFETYNQCHLSVENAMAGIHEMGLEYKKSDSNGKAKRSLSAVVKAPVMDTEMAFDGEIEIDRKFNVRIFANPTINQVQYPCQMIYQENSNPNLDINLQIPLTGLMGSEQSCKSSQKPLVFFLVVAPKTFSGLVFLSERPLKH